MRTLIRKISNMTLRPLGLEIRRIDSPRLFPPIFAQTINELLGACCELQVADLPPDERRIPLMMELMGAKLSQCIYLMGHLHQALQVEGDVCEFGVAAGATSALIANEIKSSEKKLWLFDSFQGLPKPTEKDKLLDDVMGLGTMENYEGAMSFPPSCVMKRLQDLDFPPSRTVIVPGFIEQTLREEPMPKKVAFAYVDLDFYEPIKVTLEFLHKAITPGGFIAVDDYGFLSEGAKVAVDEFFGIHSSAYIKIVPHAFAGPFVILHRKPNA